MRETLTELEMLKIIAVRAAVLVVMLEDPPSVNGAMTIESALRELHRALDRLDAIKAAQLALEAVDEQEHDDGQV